MPLESPSRTVSPAGGAESTLGPDDDEETAELTEEVSYSYFSPARVAGGIYIPEPVACPRRHFSFGFGFEWHRAHFTLRCGVQWLILAGFLLRRWRPR